MGSNGCCTKSNVRRSLKHNALLLATICGVIMGVVVGILMRQVKLSKLELDYFGFPGELFLRALKMIIVPLITFSLITGRSCNNLAL